jgi:hypothetical protein
MIQSLFTLKMEAMVPETPLLQVPHGVIFKKMAFIKLYMSIMDI